MTLADLEGRRILILGAGRHQVPLIRRAKARGAFVVTSDYLPDSSGRAYADVAELADALDPVCNIEIANAHDVDAVLTIGSDQAMRSVAAVASARDLPCHLSPQSAERATNKHTMTDALRRTGVPMTTRVLLSPDDDVPEPMRFPMVVKPVDGQGQRGTTRVEHHAALDEARRIARDASPRREVVVEEFLVGPEVTATGWVHDGETRFLALTDRVTYNPPPTLGIAVQHVFPSRHGWEHRAAIAAILDGVARAYEMQHGPLYVQMIIGSDGPAVVEAAARVGGGHEPALLPAIVGLDLLDRSLDLAVGQPNDPAFDVRTDAFLRHGLVNFVLARPGLLARHTTLAPLLDDGAIEDGAWYHPDGFVQGHTRDGQARVGWFLATADSREELLARAADVYARLRIADETDRNLVFWPEGPLLLGT